MRAVNEPESWWGWHGWDQPQPLSILQIIRAGTLSPRIAALLWLGIERGASFVFAAQPPGAGKTVLLTAILPFARDETVAYFTQGWGETFDLPPLNDDAPTYLLVNEMSDDLPVYSWGPYVIRIFELMADGYSMATTMHADSAQEVAEMLQDVGVPDEQIALLTFVVPIALVHRGGDALRRVREIVMFDVSEEGLVRRRLAEWIERDGAFRVLESASAAERLAARLRLSPPELHAEIDRREALLQHALASDAEEGPAPSEGQ